MQEPKPATIRIESKMAHGLNVPLPGPGKSIRGFVSIPAAQGEKLGVVETDQLDAVTVNRLRYHYDWRPSDPKLFGKKKDEIPADQLVDVGLLRISILPPGTKPRNGGDEQAEGKSPAQKQAAPAATKAA